MPTGQPLLNALCDGELAPPYLSRIFHGRIDTVVRKHAHRPAG